MSHVLLLIAMMVIARLLVAALLPYSLRCLVAIEGTPSEIKTMSLAPVTT